MGRRQTSRKVESKRAAERRGAAAAHRVELRRRAEHIRAVRLIAASLHASQPVPQEGPDSNEAAAGGTATASTTSTDWARLDGCNT